MFNWRKLPHPSYGNYGGGYRKCEKIKCPIPIDWMDAAFSVHDDELKGGNKEADHNLGVALRKGDPKELKTWGKIYRFFAMGVFR